MAQTKIRRLKPVDLKEMFMLFARVLNESFPEYSPNIKTAMTAGKKYWNKANYAKRLVNPDRYIIGAFNANKLVGLLDAEMPFAGVSFVVWLMVDKDYRGRGIGENMVAVWEKNMKKRGAHLLYLFADDRNIEFYKRVGFKISGSFEKGWFGTDDNLFTKLIREPNEENFLK